MRFILADLRVADTGDMGWRVERRPYGHLWELILRCSFLAEEVVFQGSEKQCMKMQSALYEATSHFDFGDDSNLEDVEDLEQLTTPQNQLLLTTAGALRITKERLSQMAVKDWSLDHDAEMHRDEELVWAAVCYAIPDATLLSYDPWPWEEDCKRGRTTRIRDLEKAGALLAAEIDRLLEQERKES